MDNDIRQIYEKLPDNWELVPFTKVVSVLPDGSKRVKKRDYLETGNIPVIDQGQEYIGGFTDDESMTFTGELPVVLFGDHTKSIKFVKSPFAVGADGIKILKPSSSYNIKFFFYLLHSLQIPDRGYSRHFQFLKKFDLPLAPPNEQKRIVAEIEKQFSRLDKAVENLKRVKANLKRYKASVLKAAVEGKLTEEWRKEHLNVEPADKLLERILAERRKKLEKAELAKMKKAGKEPKDDKWKRRYKETEPPKPEATFELPKTWTWCFGAQLFTWSSGKGLTKKKLKPGPYLVYGGNGINGYHFEYIVDRPTIVIGRVGANCGNVFISQEKSWITDNAIFADSIPSECFLDYFKLVYLYANLNKRAGGSGQPFVNQTILNEVAIRLPPLDEQKNIILEVERCLSVCEEIERIVDLNIIRSEHARQSILKKAFSGKLLKTIGGKDM